MINCTLRDCAEYLFDKNNVTILVHSSPDGDCVGSGTALGMALTALGKTVKVVCPHMLPERLAFLCESVPEGILCFGIPVPEDFTPDCTVSTDVASPELLGRIRELYENKIDLCIDHHMINTVNAERICRNPGAAACGEMILELIDELSSLASRPLLTKEIADMLYAAISSDCGSFKYGNTTAKTLLCASRLKSVGADSERISKLLFDTRSLAQFRLTGLAISKTELLYGGKLAFCILLDDELSALGATKEDCDGITQIFREISGVEMSIFAKQYTDSISGENCVKMSLRSNNADCTVICEAFGGGGHKKAAGCTVRGLDNEAAKKAITEKAIELCPELRD